MKLLLAFLAGSAVSGIAYYTLLKIKPEKAGFKVCSVLQEIKRHAM